jgi:hypothetical protein
VAQDPGCAHRSRALLLGPGGHGGLEHGVGKRINYLMGVFQNRAKVKWWVQNMVASGSPDFFCAEVHL